MFFFCKHKNYYYPKDFWKFICDRINNIEVIYEVIIRGVLQGAVCKVCNAKYAEHRN